MSFKNFIAIILAALFIARCSSSRNDVAKDPAQSQSTGTTRDPIQSQESVESPPQPRQLLGGRMWTPRFIPTGSASGIMIEFTGLKKNAELHARYAGVELQRSPYDSMRLLQPSTFTLTTTINDLRQAFFKVPPGTYLLHQTKEWADQSYINNVEVREGNYSVVTIEVLNPRSQKIKQVSDSDENR